MGACMSNKVPHESEKSEPADPTKSIKRKASTDSTLKESVTKSKPSSSPVVSPQPLSEKTERGSLSTAGRLSINRHLTLPPINALALPQSPSSCTKTLGNKPLLHAISPSQSMEGPQTPGNYVEVTVNSIAGAVRQGSSDSITKTNAHPMTPSMGSRAPRPATPTLKALSIFPSSPKHFPASPQNQNVSSELLERRRRHLRSSSLPEMQLQDLKAFQFQASPQSQGRSPLSPNSPLNINTEEEEKDPPMELQSPQGAEQYGKAILSRRKSLASLQLKPLDGMLDSVKLKGKPRMGRRVSECAPLESMKTFHGFTSGSLTEAPPAASRLFGGGTKSPPLASIFDEYASGAERMKYRHVLHLCHDLIDAFIEGYRQRVERELKEKKNEASAKNVEAQMATDLPYMLGEGVHKDKSKWVEIAARRMWKLLDFNDEGFVSKTKFMARFMKSCEEVLNVNQLKKLNGAQETNSPKDPCLVM